MGNSTSTHTTSHLQPHDKHDSGTPTYPFEKNAHTHASQDTPPKDNQSASVSATHDHGNNSGHDGDESAMAMPNDTAGSQQGITLSDTTSTEPVSTGRSGWVSNTGNTSPWYGSLSSSASSHHRSDSVRGPYYRTRGMSINRDSELEDDTTQQFGVYRKKSVHKAQNGVPTIITWSQGGQNVYVTGTFNGWKHKIKLVKSTSDFSAVIELPPGTHRLKFIVDDEWKCSNDMETATDPDGNLVNYLQVLDENDELEDEFAESKAEKGTSSRPHTPVEEYTSEIPPELLMLAASLSNDEDMEKNRKAANEWERNHQQPPSLPPHLDKVLLNSQNISEEDNSVLPEPNHVTLNHLYACSIKDGVMALSTTTRYRKKYVTTMYYQPVLPKS